MKLLKIKFTGLPLCSNELEIDFYANQKVIHNDSTDVNHLFSNIYTNNVLSVVGPNASGKTTVLKAISFVMQLLQLQSINKIPCNTILEEMKETVCIESFFYNNKDTVYKLQTHITKNQNEYCIDREFLWGKDISSVGAKVKTLVFNETHLIKTNENAHSDISLLANYCDYIPFAYSDTMHDNPRTLRAHTIPKNILSILDPSIESIQLSPNGFLLKFNNREGIKTDDLTRYLSSGTIKGINLFHECLTTIKNGGYLLVDDLENHLSLSTIQLFIQLFLNAEFNKNGATIIFSTNNLYTLSSIRRNDSIFVTNNLSNIEIKNVATILRHYHAKQKESLQNNNVLDHNPTYDDCLRFVRQISKYVDAPAVNLDMLQK